MVLMHIHTLYLQWLPVQQQSAVLVEHHITHTEPHGLVVDSLAADNDFCHERIEIRRVRAPQLWIVDGDDILEC